MAETEAYWQLKFEKGEQRCGHLLEYKLWPDCSFVVGSEKIEAHKLILAMASPVFERMFYGGSLDPYELKITDIQPETFKSLLQYIYTRITDIGSLDMAWSLSCGAKKYKLPHLVKECNRYICSVLSSKNACRVYEMARLYDEKTLVDKCIQIITTNSQDVLNDNSFDDVELDTVITVCSLDNLNVDELELFQAVEDYAKAEQRRQGLISPPGDEPPSEKQSEQRLQPPTSEGKVLLPIVESTSQTSPAELDSETPTEGTPSEPAAEKEILKEVRLRIRPAVEKIRFLSLSEKEFAEGPVRSGLLTWDESYAVLMNIAATNSTESMPTGFSECRERRQPRGGSVEEGPFAIPRPVTKATAEIVRGLLSDEERTLEKAARAARLMTCADADGASENVAQLVAARAIPPLVTALRHPSTDVQHDAACAISNIACVSEHVAALVDGGAVPVLVGLLDRGGAVAEQAARALGNIAAPGKTARDAVINAGAPSALLAHMQPGAPAAPLGTYMRTYRIICQKDDHSDWSQWRFEQLLPAMPYIEELLLLPDEQVLADACWALYYLAGIAYQKEQLFTSTLAERLTALLRPGAGAAAAPRVQTAALAAMANILSSGVKLLEVQYIEAGCLDIIVYFLKSGNHSHVEQAARAAERILGYPHIEQALDKGILDALVPALTEGDVNCKRNAARAIRSFCELGSALCMDKLAASAAMEPFCRLLADRGDTCTSVGGNICSNVLDGLTAMLKKIQQNTTFIILRLREIGVPQLLKPLKRDENKRTRQVVDALLRTHFTNDPVKKKKH